MKPRVWRQIPGGEDQDFLCFFFIPLLFPFSYLCSTSIGNVEAEETAIQGKHVTKKNIKEHKGTITPFSPRQVLKQEFFYYETQENLICSNYEKFLSIKARN